MSPIILYLVLKYLVEISPVTPLIFSKTSKNRRFLIIFFQSRPVFGQYRPNGRSDGQNYFLKTQRIKFRVDLYTADAYPISQFLTLSSQPNIHTYTQTYKHPYSINIYRLGLRPSTPLNASFAG